MNELPMFIIYKQPKDYPAGYVVRRWVIRDGRSVPDIEALTAPTLEKAREMVPEGLYRLPRDPTDDPVIVETWL